MSKGIVRGKRQDNEECIIMVNIIYTGEAPKKEIFQIFHDTISQLIEQDKSVVYIDADLMSSMRTKDLWTKYPQNVINTGIQEANMIGIAAGMYLYGKKTYVHSFAPFATRRCFDQIYESIGYAQKSIRIIGSEPGICATDNGGTHMTFEDIALIRTIPGSVIFDISDGIMLHKVLNVTKNMEGVIYIRTPRRGLPDIYSVDEEFKVGVGKKIKSGKDCTVIASGIMVSTAIEAATLLLESGIDVEIIDPITIKPLDEKIIIESAKKCGKVVTIENHSIYGGLGGAVSELLSEKYPVKVKRIGMAEFGQVGNESYLREQFHFTKYDVANEIKKICGGIE